MAASTQQVIPGRVFGQTAAGEIDTLALSESFRPSGAQPATGSAVDFGLRPDHTLSEEAREEAGWGRRYQPPLDGENYESYRRICDELNSEVATLKDFLVDGAVVEEASGIVAEIENDLERLYDCKWGQGESLKRAVVAIQSQINNAQWKEKHVDFLRSAVSFLRVRYLVNDQAIEELYEMIEQHGLDPFRGSVSDSEVTCRYRIERIQ